MSANFNDNVNIVVSPDAAPVGRAGFGVGIVADAAGMSERVRFYTGPDAAVVDQGAGDITAAQLLAIQTAFSQSPRPARVGAGRVSFTDVAQVITFTYDIGGAAGTINYTVTVGNSTFNFAGDASNPPGDDLDSLASLINAGSEPVTATSPTDTTLVLTADVAGDAFDASASADQGSFTEALTTPNQSVATELAALLDDNSAWYGLTLVSRADKDVRRAAQWVESQNRIYVAQSSSADVLTTATDDIASELQDLSLGRTALLWYSDDADPADFAWMTKVLATDLDTETTQWAYKTLANIGVDDDEVTITQKLNAEAKNVNFYLTLGGVGATGQGKMVGGRFIDVTTTVDWLTARTTEALQQALLDYSNRNSKIPYTDDGFAVIDSLVEGVLDTGIRAGHFERTEDGASPFVNLPLRSEVDQADATARRLSFTFGALLSGAVLLVNGTGTVTTSTDTIALLAGIEEV